MNSNTTTTATPSASASARLLFCGLMVLVLLVAQSYRTEAKALNNNLVKFRRVPPKEFSAALGSSITIECDAQSSPSPTIHWLKNGKRIIQNEYDENQLDDGSGQPLQTDEVSRISLSNTRALLNIDCADVSDEATYTCVAENTFSRISTHTKLNLIRSTVQPASGSGENDLASDEAVSSSSLAAVPQCLSNRGRTQAPPRIHMWTYQIAEYMKNDIILFCRSNLKRPAPLHHGLNLISSSNKQLEEVPSAVSSQPTLTWTLPTDKLVSEDQKDKYEVLENGDLLIKDLSWGDMGTYACSVADDVTVTTFVYPMKPKGVKRAAPPSLPLSSSSLLTRFTR